MKNKKNWLGMLVIVLVCGMVAISCDNGSTSAPYNNDAGELAGTWNGTVMGYTATVTVSNSGWILSIPSLSYADTGSFHRNGNSAILYSSSNGKNVVGTANIINSNSVQLVLNNNSAAPGTYTLTRQ